MLERNRRWPIAALVLFGHVLLLLLLDEILQEEPLAVVDGRRSVLFFIPPTKRPPHVPIELSQQMRRSSELHPPNRLAPRIQAIDPATAGSVQVPPVNWQHEASEAARHAIEAQRAADALKFSEASKAPAKKCVKPKAPEWRKETPTYGFSGGLPFMRFHDDRCIFVLLFVGCAFGAKPEADSHLFDNMRNYPNDSSVPDLDECEDAP